MWQQCSKLAEKQRGCKSPVLPIVYKPKNSQFLTAANRQVLEQKSPPALQQIKSFTMLNKFIYPYKAENDRFLD